MMPFLDQFVRGPFLGPSATWPRIPTAPSPPVDGTAVQLCWGTVGKLPEPVSRAVDFNVGCAERQNEIEGTRKSDLVRIEDPNNKENYIMVERAQQMSMTKKETKSNPFSFAFASAVAAGIQEFTAEAQVAFSPAGSTNTDCQLKVTLKNGPTSA
jgi:hypothetical protein